MILYPSFTKYSLILVKDKKIIYSSDKSGLEPLLECIQKYNNLKNCRLYDKVIGLAAAKLIVYANMFSSIITRVCSKKAKYLLEKRGVEIKTKKIVNYIFASNRSSLCPFELKAQQIKNEKLFFEHIEMHLDRG